MTIYGTTLDVVNNLKDAFHNWNISVIENDGLYDVQIPNETPFILKYSHPVAKVEIGSHVVEINNDEFVSISFM